MLAWFSTTGIALRWVAAAVSHASADRVALQGVRGSLFGTLHADRVRVQAGPARFDATDVDLAWQPRALWRRRVVITRLTAQRIVFAPNQPAPNTKSSGGALRLPVSIAIEDVRIAHLDFNYPGGPYRLEKLRAQGDADARGLRIQAQGFDQAVSVRMQTSFVPAKTQLDLQLRGLRAADVVAAPPIDAQLSGNVHLTMRNEMILFKAAIADSRVGGYPLAGLMQGAWKRGDEVRDVRVDLASAGNRVRATGAFGHVGDRLDWSVTAPHLDRLGTAFHGDLQAHGFVGDTFAVPRLILAAQAHNARAGDIQLRMLRADAALGGGPHGTLRASALLSDLRVGTVSVLRAGAHVLGTRAQHEVRLDAHLHDESLAVSAHGGWDGREWNGRLAMLRAVGRVPMAMGQGAASLRVSRSQLALKGLRLNVAGGQIDLRRLDYGATGWHSDGHAAAIALAALQPMLPRLAHVHTTLVVDGDWDVALGARTTAGQVRLERRRGDIMISGGAPLALGLTRLSASLAAVAGRLSLRAQVDGTHFGTAEVQAHATLARRDGRLGIPGSTPIDLDAHASLPSLAWAASLSPVIVRMDGAVDADVHARGTLARTQWTGDVRGRRLQFHWPDQGVALTDGLLSARFTGDRLFIDDLHFTAGHGTVSAHGDALLAAPSLTLKATARDASLVQRADRTIVASGSTTVTWRDGQWRINGETRIERALVDLPEHAGPTLSDDIVVVGRTTPRAPRRSGAGAAMDVRIALGDHFYVKGRGLDARLGGSVRVRSQAHELPTANGTIRVAEGSYSAYGQRLTVERGIVSFSGPLDNPALNLLAMRKNTAAQPGVTPVQAGVAVTGTALHPIVKLVSQPEVSDSEKLAWLVLGHGLEGSSGGELDLLSSAAGALLARGESVSLQARIAQRAGLDEFRVSGNGGLQQAIVTVGKRVSSRAYVTYEHGLTATNELLKIRYALSKRWSLQTQAGSSTTGSSGGTAVDLFYTWSFD